MGAPATVVPVTTHLGEEVGITYSRHLQYRTSRAGLTEVWVRTTYRKWLPNFPMFPVPVFTEWFE